MGSGSHGTGDRLCYNDILNIEYAENPAWSQSGRYLSYSCLSKGVQQLVISESGEWSYIDLPRGSRPISEWRWNPVDDSLVTVVNGSLWLIRIDENGRARSLRLTDTSLPERRPSWSPDGKTLAFARGDGLWSLDIDLGRTVEHRMAGPFYFHSGAPAVAWSQDGRHLAYTYLHEQSQRRVAVGTADGDVIWISKGDGEAGYLEADPHWVDGGLAFSRCSAHNTIIERLWVNLGTGEEELIHRSEDPRGIPFLRSPVVCPRGKRLALVLDDQGWDKIYVWTRGSGLMKITSGEWDDSGHATDNPAWSPDGDQLVFASNRGEAEKRCLWVVSPDDQSCRRLTEPRASSEWPTWSPDGRWIAYVHTSQREAASISLVSPEEGLERSIFSGTPQRIAQMLYEPEILEWTAPDGVAVRGVLIDPPKAVNTEPRPALVFVHGGPIRQMRSGWHPSPTYAFFYGVHQVLAQRGVVGLLVNFRGGLGYGKEFSRGLYQGMGRSELGDVISGAHALVKERNVDPERIAIWGISYGGYLVMHAMAQFPEVFSCGINIAGNYDRLGAIPWKDKRYPGYSDYKLACMGEGPVLEHLSPRNHREGLRKAGPMLHLHGTEDEAVDFEQLHTIIADSVDLGLRFEASAYPGESHFFRRPETWRDAMRRMDHLLERSLGIAPQNGREEQNAPQ